MKEKKTEKFIHKRKLRIKTLHGHRTGLRSEGDNDSLSAQKWKQYSLRILRRVNNTHGLRICK